MRLYVLIAPLFMAIACAVACGDGSTPASPGADVVATDPEGDAAPADAARPKREAAVYCEPEDASGAVIPSSYADKTNPLAGDARAVSAGETRFATRCTPCHGAEGKGDGRERTVRPPPADLTARRRSAAWLFWRISEGGVDLPFCSAMPAFKNYFDETERWELVTYVQTLAPAPDAADEP